MSSVKVFRSSNKTIQFVVSVYETFMSRRAKTNEISASSLIKGGAHYAKYSTEIGEEWWQLPDVNQLLMFACQYKIEMKIGKEGTPFYVDKLFCMHGQVSDIWVRSAYAPDDPNILVDVPCEIEVS